MRISLEAFNTNETRNMKDLAKLSENVFYVGVNDRTKHLFEGLWSLPCGVSYNAYLVCGERTALIDTVDGCFTERLLSALRQRLAGRTLDYLVVNHMEPDHSASMAAIRREYPGVKIVGNAKTLQMVAGYYGLTSGVVEVREGSTLDLGGATLSFSLIPMVHWPETMVTYLAEEQMLFSGDAFGTFGALDGGVTDEELDADRYWEEMRRYYACIVGKYGAPVQKALAKLAGVPIAAICPTHGPVWRKRVSDVVSLYDRMSRDETEPGVVVAYGSMYGNTEQMAERIARQLSAEGVRPVRVYNLSTADASVVLRDVFRYRGLVIGSPTYNGALYPQVDYLLRKIAERNLPPRVLGCFGSFTWAGTAVRCLTEFAAARKWELTGVPVEMKQGYSTDCEAQCDALAREIAAKVK